MVIFLMMSLPCGVVPLKYCRASSSSGSSGSGSSGWTPASSKGIMSGSLLIRRDWTTWPLRLGRAPPETPTLIFFIQPNYGPSENDAQAARDRATTGACRRAATCPRKRGCGTSRGPQGKAPRRARSPGLAWREAKRVARTAPSCVDDRCRGGVIRAHRPYTSCQLWWSYQPAVSRRLFRCFGHTSHKALKFPGTCYAADLPPCPDCRRWQLLCPSRQQNIPEVALTANCFI